MALAKVFDVESQPSLFFPLLALCVKQQISSYHTEDSRLKPWRLSDVYQFYWIQLSDKSQLIILKWLNDNCSPLSHLLYEALCLGKFI